MTTRLRKQIFFGIFYIVFFAAIGGGFYYLFIKPAPSCFDNIQNQGERGIDCGGPCAKICIPQTIKQIVVSRSFAFVLDKTHVSLLAQINNPNSDYAAKNFTYKFSLYDNTGAAIQTFSGNSFTYAGEVKYVFIPNAAVPSVNFSRVDFQIENPNWVPAASLEGPPKLNIFGIEMRTVGDNIAVSGQITNKDTVGFGKIMIIALFRGKMGQLMGVSQTEMETLSPNAQRPFSIIHPPISDVNLTATELAAYAFRQ